jgi:hypothetical protein
LLSSFGKKVLIQMPKNHLGTVDVYHRFFSRRGQVFAELACHGRQYSFSIWRVLPAQGSLARLLPLVPNKFLFSDSRPDQIQHQFLATPAVA